MEVEKIYNERHKPRDTQRENLGKNLEWKKNYNFFLYYLNLGDSM